MSIEESRVNYCTRRNIPLIYDKMVLLVILKLEKL